MLSLGGIFGALGRMLPGYIEGREQAIKSNWNDLNQYNQVQAGQIQNAFNELTFPQAFNMYMDRAGISRASMLQTLMNLGSRVAGYPYELQTGYMRSQQGPGVYQQRINQTLAESQRAAQNAQDPTGGLGNLSKQLGFDLTGFQNRLNNVNLGINPGAFANEGWMRGQNPMQQQQTAPLGTQTAPLGTQTAPTATLGQGNGILDGVNRPSPFGPK